MTTYACKGGIDLALTLDDKVALIKSALDKINRPLKKVLILPPAQAGTYYDASFHT